MVDGRGAVGSAEDLSSAAYRRLSGKVVGYYRSLFTTGKECWPEGRDAAATAVSRRYNPLPINTLRERPSV